MRRKKPNSQTSKDPFQQRKGSSVSEEIPPGKSDPEEEPASRDDEFLQEMARRGVRRRDDGELCDADEMDREDALFLAAMEESERFDVPGDGSENCQPYPAHQARARRARRLARGEISPGSELDLHGLTRTEALEKVRFFLENAVYRGEEAVLIITGKGAGSDSKPVLNRSMREALASDFRKLVLEFCPAPARLGGSGALVVFLRRPF